MEQKIEMIEQVRKDAWQEGYDDAMKMLRSAIKLRDMGIKDCEIVKITGLAPVIVHGMFLGTCTET